MAINDIVQTIAEARVDARSLSEFVFKPAGFKVTRRLAPPVDTLQFYIDRFNSLNGDFSSSVSVALSSLSSSVAEANGKVAYIESTVQDAINNTAVEGGVLADTFVTATSSAIGSVARTQRHKNSDVVSVKDFGAKGDGVTDDTLAIQAAIDSTITSSKDVYIPHGDYIHTGLSVLNRRLIGDGTLIHTGIAAGITLRNQSGLEGLRIVGNNTTDNILVDASSNVLIRNNEIRFGKNNIRVKFVTFGLSIDSNILAQSASDNIVLVQAKRSVISNNYISSANGWGVNADSTTAVSPDQQHGVIIQGNHVFGNKDGGIRAVGLIADKSQHFMIQNNHIDHNQEDAVLTRPSWGIYAENVEKLMVVGNLIRTQTVMGCEFLNVVSPVVIGNTFWKSTTNTALTATDFKATNSVGEWGHNHTESKVDGIEDWGVSDRLTSRSTVYRARSDIYIDAFRIQRNASGGNEGNMFFNLNTDIAKRRMEIYNGSRTDFTLRVRGDLELTKNLIIPSPNGTLYKVVVSDTGIITATTV